MRILLIADGRSPTTRSWVRAVGALGHSVVLVSTYPCAPVEGVEADVCLPVAFSALGGSASGGSATGSSATGASARRSPLRRVVAALRPLFLTGRYLLGPLTLRYFAPRLRWLVENIQPDLVHALRIPYEGMLAAALPPGVPLAVSIWGNDLTLHAVGSRSMAARTRRTLARADALLADTRRDIRLAQAWGFDPARLTLVIPGSGGLDMDALEAVRGKVQRWGSAFDDLLELDSPPGAGDAGLGHPDLVVNPRGFRTGSVRQDVFFQAVPLVLRRRPNARFACAAMEGQREAIEWVSRLGIADHVTLLPHLPQEDLWELLSRAAVSVSVSQHDGTPNTLLEAMALGAFPVAGDIESIREWITPGVNGLLVEPTRPESLADAIVLALENPALRLKAAEMNARMVCDRASQSGVREKLGEFYERVGRKKED